MSTVVLRGSSIRVGRRSLSLMVLHLRSGLLHVLNLRSGSGSLSLNMDNLRLRSGLLVALVAIWVHHMVRVVVVIVAITAAAVAAAMLEVDNLGLGDRAVGQIVIGRGAFVVVVIAITRTFVVDVLGLSVGIVVRSGSLVAGSHVVAAVVVLAGTITVLLTVLLGAMVVVAAVVAGGAVLVAVPVVVVLVVVPVVVLVVVLAVLVRSAILSVGLGLSILRRILLSILLRVLLSILLGVLLRVLLGRRNRGLLDRLLVRAVHGRSISTVLARVATELLGLTVGVSGSGVVRCDVGTVVGVHQESVDLGLAPGAGVLLWCGLVVTVDEDSRGALDLHATSERIEDCHVITVGDVDEAELDLLIGDVLGLKSLPLGFEFLTVAASRVDESNDPDVVSVIDDHSLEGVGSKRLGGTPTGGKSDLLRALVVASVGCITVLLVRSGSATVLVGGPLTGGSSDQHKGCNE